MEISKKLIAAAVIIVLALIAGIFMVAPPHNQLHGQSVGSVDQCQNITVPGTVLTLATDIDGTGYANCLDVQADNVTIDCQGHNIANSATGINLNGNSNVLIENCNINNVSTGLNVYANNLTFENSNITSSGDGIADNWDYGVVSNSLFTNLIIQAGGAGFDDPTFGDSLSNTSFSNINITSVGVGILNYFDSGTTNILANSSVESSSSYALNMHYDSTFTVINSSLMGEVLLAGSSDNFCLDVFNNSGGMYVSGGSGSSFNCTYDGLNQGNIWANVINGSVSINNSGITSSIPGFAIGSTEYSDANSQGLTSGVTDYAPLVPGTICQNLTIPNTVFNLANNLDGTGFEYCLDVQADNVTINCNGNSIANAGTSDIHSDGGYSQITVQNCVLNDFAPGIDMHFVNGLNISNVTETSPSMGLTVVFSNNTIFDNVNVSAGSYGVYFYGNSNSTVSNSNITSTGANGIDVEQSDAVNIINSNITTTACAHALGTTGVNGLLLNSTLLVANNSCGNPAFQDEDPTAPLSNSILSGDTIISDNQGSGAADPAIQFFGGEVNVTIQNSMLIGDGVSGEGGAGVLTLFNSINSTIINNSLSTTSYADYGYGNYELAFDQNGVWSGSSGNIVCLNNFSQTSESYIYDLSGGLNSYNCSFNGKNQGNIYANVIDSQIRLNGSNITSSISGFNISPQEYSDNNSLGLTSGVVDYAPLVPASGWPLECVNITAPNVTLNLTNNMTGFDSACINIETNNATVNCNGYTITDPNGGGILNNGYNNTNINDCILNAQYGLGFIGANNISVFTSQINADDEDADFTGCNNVIMSNVGMNTTGDGAVDMEENDGNNFLFNDITMNANGGNGFSNMGNMINVTIANSTMVGGGYGSRLNVANFNIDNVFMNFTLGGIVYYPGDVDGGFNLANSTIISTATGDAVDVFNSNQTSITDTTAIGGPQGILFDGVNTSNISNIYAQGIYGAQLTDTYLVNVSNSVLNDSGGCGATGGGIRLSNSYNDTVFNNTIIALTQPSALILDQSSADNLAIFNTLSGGQLGACGGTQGGNIYNYVGGAGNTFCLNNFLGGGNYYYQANTAGQTNFSCVYNGKEQGNIWANVVNGSVLVWDSHTPSAIPGYDIGASQYNDSISQGETIGVNDYYPLVPTFCSFSPAISKIVFSAFLTPGQTTASYIYPAHQSVTGWTYSCQNTRSGDEDLLIELNGDFNNSDVVEVASVDNFTSSNLVLSDIFQPITTLAPNETAYVSFYRNYTGLPQSLGQQIPVTVIMQPSES